MMYNSLSYLGYIMIAPTKVSSVMLSNSFFVSKVPPLCIMGNFLSFQMKLQVSLDLILMHYNSFMSKLQLLGFQLK
jgi:hypothetical protein